MTTTDDPMLVVTDELVGPTTLIRCVGEVDVATVPQLRDRVSRLQVDGASRVVIDLSGVTFIDSLGLGALIGAHKRARVLRGSLVIVPSEAATRVFVATALDRVFEIRATLDEALAD
ncbi:STAS domain-containing protein [soil metagenome]